MPIEIDGSEWRRTFVRTVACVVVVALSSGCGARLDDETGPSQRIAATPTLGDVGIDAADPSTGEPDTAPPPRDADVVFDAGAEAPHDWATGTLCDPGVARGFRPMTSLASLGIDHRTVVGAVWTGKEMLVAATSPLGCTVPPCWPKQAIFAYDPATDRWRLVRTIDVYDRTVKGSLLSLEDDRVARVDLEDFTYWATPAAGGTSVQTLDRKATCVSWGAGVGYAPTSKELVVWGGGRWEDGPSWIPCGQGVAIHQPEGVTRVLAEAPSTMRGGHVSSMWTGSALLVVDWDDRHAARYEAELDRWTDLGPLPSIDARDAPAAAGMLGGKVGFFGGLSFGGNESSFAALDGASFDVASSTWTKLPAAPLTDKGDRWRDDPTSWMQPGPSGSPELVMFGGYGYDHSELLGDMIAVDATTGAWRTVSSGGGLGPRTNAIAVWDGCEAIVYGGTVGSGGATLTDGALYKP